MRRRHACLVVGLYLLAGCRSSTSPTPVTLTASCPQPDLWLGSSVSCASSPAATWSTSTPALVRLTGSQVTALASGQATVTATANGQTVSIALRTYPHYAAQPFPVRWTVTSCQQTGTLASADICSGTPIGYSDTGLMAFSQAGARASTTIGGFGLPSTSVTSDIALDGSLRFTLSGQVGPLAQQQVWTLNSLDGQRLTGRITLTWRDGADTAIVEFVLAPV